MTQTEYQKKILKCCSLKTEKEHREVLMYCWSVILSSDIEKNCEHCEFNSKNQPVNQHR